MYLYAIEQQMGNAMKIDIKNHKRLIKNALVFILGGFLVSLVTDIVIMKPLVNYFSSVSEEEIRDFLDSPQKFISSTILHLYIVSYVLFALLPKRIHTARTALKILYFIIFYLFVSLIYFMI